MTLQTPRDLANFVYGCLNSDESCPSIAELEDLFQKAFLASLKTEEGEPVRFTVAFVNPAQPDPDPPPSIRDPRWRYFPLSPPMEYSIGKLAKLAMAADPASSCLAVSPNKKGALTIWGMFDQQKRFQATLEHEAEGGWEPPGVLQVQVLGLGHIIVIRGFEMIAELNGGVLVEDTVDVFEGTMIYKKFSDGFDECYAQIVLGISDCGFDVAPNYKKFCCWAWVNIIRRILLRARSFHHGGAFLFTDSPFVDRIRLKHEISYPRIPELFIRKMINSYVQGCSWDTIRQGLDNNLDSIDPDSYFENVHAEAATSDADEALGGAVAFIAGLSRVDGLVLLDKKLRVLGFGGEIVTAGADSCIPYTATHAFPSKGKSVRLHTEKFGTRHRSMLRICSEDGCAVGFVISSDGPVRAITKSGNRVYLWDNVKVRFSMMSLPH